MPGLARLFSDGAVDTMRRTIQEAHGHEVFFLATGDDSGCLQEVMPLARGNDSAVPALMQVASRGDVIVHNHPSGHLVPSAADLEVASHYGNLGVGFHIVNNAVSQVYVVVEAFKKEAPSLLHLPGVLELFGPQGALAQKLANYESRPEQRQMAETVATAFNNSQVALIEAATGTGKSLAYLVPAILWAVHNKQRVVVSTNTINLQEQLIHKDLPLLKQAMDGPFNAVLVKGRYNYLCLDKLNSLDQQGRLMLDEKERADIAALFEWAQRTQDGSRSDLALNPAPSLWEKVACESDNCARIKCEFYSRCFFYKARREAASADLLVVNHHLLFSDLVVRLATGQFQDAAVLPAYSRIIIDEAHNLEEIATEYFGMQISRISLHRLLARFYQVQRRGAVREKGALPFLLSRLHSLEKEIDPDFLRRIVDQVQNHLLPERDQLSFLVDHVFEGFSGWFESTSQESAGVIKIRFTPDLYNQMEWQNTILAGVRDLLHSMRLLHQQCWTLNQNLSKLPEGVQEALQRQRVELQALGDRLETAAVTLSEIFGAEESGKVRWIELAPAPSGKSVTIRQVPLFVADLLRETVFQRFKTVVMTSATLTSEQRLDYLKERLGLQQGLEQRLAELVLPPVFDYQRQAILGIPTDLPYPNHQNYAAALSRCLLGALTLSGGRALVLFTSYALLQRTYQELAQPLNSLGIVALRQGEAPRHQLTQQFKRDKTSVLFATDSFWEGVDVAGDALENLILTKLPFSVPRDPVVAARVEAIQKRNGNPFLEYIVPQAVIRFRQGFGRLIRNQRDRGCILILDRRVLDKPYGRTFLNSLPDCQQVVGTTTSVLERLADFFQGGPAAREDSSAIRSDWRRGGSFDSRQS